MTEKKEAAAGDANTRSGDEKGYINTVTQKEEEIKLAEPAPMWKAAEAAHEQKIAAEKKLLLRYGLLTHCPARWLQKDGDTIEYEQITALIYRINPYNGGVDTSVKMIDKQRNANTAKACDVEPVIPDGVDPTAFEWESGVIGERLKELKTAMRCCYTVKCHHVEMRRISAIIIRSPSPGRISLEVELVMPDGALYTVPERYADITGHMLNRTASGGQNGL